MKLARECMGFVKICNKGVLTMSINRIKTFLLV